MKRLWILAAVLAVMLTPCMAQAGMLDDLQTDLVYAQSFEHPDMKTTLARVSMPVKDFKIDEDKTLSLNADLLGFIESADLGLGASLTISNLIGKLGGGVGWLPKGYGLSGYIAFKF